MEGVQHEPIAADETMETRIDEPTFRGRYTPSSAPMNAMDAA
jgi:hypothetical protein